LSLTAEHISVRYGQRLAVRDCAVNVPKQEFVALIGPNGAGKSSLLRALAGLVPRTGTVSWGEQPIANEPSRERAQTIGYLPQIPELHWPIRVRELIALGRLPHRSLRYSLTADDRHRVDEALERTGTMHLAERSADELSGGELRLVQLARLLAVGAPCLLVDEPAANLDPRHQLMAMNVLREHAASGGATIAVMHDLSLGARFCSRMLMMRDGAIEHAGTPAEVLTEERIRDVYRVEPIVVTTDGVPIVVPGQLLD
jgi:iron complex transport system ATP-binding protein